MSNDLAPPPDHGVADPTAADAAAPAPTPDAAPAEAAAEPAAPSFDDMGLHPDVRRALDDMGYVTPTPVQTAVFRPVSDGKDLLVQSRTGTGKTTAFGLPTISKMVPSHRAPQALILAPTRELALQVCRELTQVGKHRGIIVEPIYGGAPIGKQITALRNGVHVVVGTPGRLLDLAQQGHLQLGGLSVLVLDEADEMLDLGFLPDIERILRLTPDTRQSMLFSATMPPEIRKLADTLAMQRLELAVVEDRDFQTGFSYSNADGRWHGFIASHRLSLADARSELSRR